VTDGEYSWIERRWLAPILEANELRLSVRRGKVIARKGWVRALAVRSGPAATWTTCAGPAWLTWLRWR